MGRIASYQLYQLNASGVGVILKGHTRISAYNQGVAREIPYIMTYQSDLNLALTTNQFWRSNAMMLDGTSISRHGADYVFPKEGSLLYFFPDSGVKPKPDDVIEIHTQIGEKGDGF